MRRLLVIMMHLGSNYRSSLKLLVTMYTVTRSNGNLPGFAFFTSATLPIDHFGLWSPAAHAVSIIRSYEALYTIS